MPGSMRKPASAAGHDSGRHGPSRIQRSQILGLILIALLLLVLAFLRADWRTFFAPGWWHLG